MAPSASPFFTVPALDVRRPDHPHSYDSTDMINVLAETQPSAAAAAAPTSSGGVSGAVIGLAILLVVVGIGAIAAVYYIVRQRKQLLSMGTIRVLYNVDNLTKDTEANKTGTDVAVDQEKGANLDPAALGEKLYTIDLSDNQPSRPMAAPRVSVEAPHVLPPPHLRRKHTRTVARQRLRIVIPSGVAIPDVELVTTATLPANTPNTGVSSAVSATRTTASRRSTARTPRSALMSAVTAISTAAIGVVHRREKVEPVYQSNGWAPATIVYLPKNPRDTTRSPSVAGGFGRKVARKSTRRVPTTASTTVAHGLDDVKASPIA